MSAERRAGRLVDAVDTRLFVVEVGPPDGYPVLVLHGGPGEDHTEFADYLDPLGERGYRLLLVDQRGHGRSEPSPEHTWTLAKMAEDVASLGRTMELGRYAVLGHSYGAMVTLQNAVDFPGTAAQTIVSGGIPSARYLSVVERNLEAFEPEHLRRQVAESWEREERVRTPEEFAEMLWDQMPFHFADPLDPRIEEYRRRRVGTCHAPAVLRKLAAEEYGAIDVENQLERITQPVLILAGRYDRVCSATAAEDMAVAIPDARLVVFERSGHMTFVEENQAYLDAVDSFLREHR